MAGKKQILFSLIILFLGCSFENNLFPNTSSFKSSFLSSGEELYSGNIILAQAPQSSPPLKEFCICLNYHPCQKDYKSCPSQIICSDYICHEYSEKKIESICEVTPCRLRFFDESNRLILQKPDPESSEDPMTGEESFVDESNELVLQKPDPESSEDTMPGAGSFNIPGSALNPSESFENSGTGALGWIEDLKIETESPSELMNRQFSIHNQRALNEIAFAKNIESFNRSFDTAIDISIDERIAQFEIKWTELLKSKSYTQFFKDFSEIEDLSIEESLEAFIRHHFEAPLKKLILNAVSRDCQMRQRSRCVPINTKQGNFQGNFIICPPYRCPEAEPVNIFYNVEKNIEKLVNRSKSRFKNKLDQAFTAKIEDFKYDISYPYREEIGRILGEMNINWDNDILETIDSIEKDLRKIKEEADSSYLNEEKTLEILKEIEDKIYEEAGEVIEDIAVEHAVVKAVNQTASLDKNLDRAFDRMRRDRGIHVNIKDLYEEQERDKADFYNQIVQEPLYEILRSKLDRPALGLFEQDEILGEDLPDYEFQSPEGAFLDKNKSLYESLYQSNPYHEQGQKARQLGLHSVETADELYAEGNMESAELAHHLGESLLDIALGVIPYVGLGKDIYEAFTGLHLITGRGLGSVERSMAFAGIALSALSGGLLSSGTFKNFYKLEPVIQRIVQKGSYLTDKSYSHALALLKEMQNLGVKNLKEFREASFLLKSSLVEKAPDFNKALSILKSMGREGLEAYRLTLRSLGEAFPEAGKRFLAKKLRFYKSTSSELLQVGGSYKQYYDKIDSIQFNKISNLTVWRAVKKEGLNREGAPFKNKLEDVFKIHPGTQLSEARYSIKGSEALYTSSTRNTALKEALKGGGVEADYHIASKQIHLDKVLDLTNSNKLGKLKLDLEKITNPSYKETQVIGDIARTKGFDGIKVPVAGSKSDFNIVIFD